MTWVYKKGDNFDLNQLLAMKKFFEHDLMVATVEVLKAKKFEKYKLPRWNIEIARRQAGVIEAEENLRTVNKAIKDHNNER